MPEITPLNEAGTNEAGTNEAGTNEAGTNEAGTNEAGTNEAGTNEADALEAARLKFEAEKMTRRAALRKLGITSGMAFFSLFAVDDLARMAIKKMRQNEATRDIAETVATEFKDSGIALAQAQNRPCIDTGCGQCEPECMIWNCTCPTRPEDGSCLDCITAACGRCFGAGSTEASNCINQRTTSQKCQSKDA